MVLLEHERHARDAVLAERRDDAAIVDLDAAGVEVELHRIVGHRIGSRHIRREPHGHRFARGDDDSLEDPRVPGATRRDGHSRPVDEHTVHGGADPSRVPTGASVVAPHALHGETRDEQVVALSMHGREVDREHIHSAGNARAARARCVQRDGELVRHGEVSIPSGNGELTGAGSGVVSRIFSGVERGVFGPGFTRFLNAAVGRIRARVFAAVGAGVVISGITGILAVVTHGGVLRVAMETAAAARGEKERDK